MPCANKHLVLFTAEFPYGNKSETFLETELKYLTNHFTSVTIVPTTKSSSCRKLPHNVFVDDRLTVEDPRKSKKLSILFKNTILVCRLLISESSDKGIYKVIANIKEYLDFIAQQLIKSTKIKAIPKVRDENVILYDYWFQNSTLALSILKQRKVLSNFICRGHGLDLYDERAQPTGIKFRYWIIKKVKAVFVISEFGVRYLRSKTKSEFHSKIRVSKLGVIKPKQMFSKEREDKITIVSCSSILPFKQVERIPVILTRLNKPIHWVHFGDGPSKKLVEANCHDLPKNITFDLKGHVNNADVLNFYQNNKVDLFISLSTSEGLPVSMMEAQSYGIPVLAYPIGGIPELVIPNLTGGLFQKAANNDRLTLTLIHVLDTNFQRSEILHFFKKNFNAEVNYTNFINDLCQ